MVGSAHAAMVKPPAVSGSAVAGGRERFRVFITHGPIPTRMDVEETKESLGEVGQKGALALVLGLLVVARENKVAALGVTLVVVGMGMVARGLVESAMEEMGMGGML
jgi:hypothetical protein